MPIALIITFAILGIALIVLEIFFLPGTTIAGVAGGLFLVASVWVAFASFGSDIGWYNNRFDAHRIDISFRKTRSNGQSIS